MTLKHLSEGLIIRVLNRRATGDDIAALLRHVLETCGECSSRICETARDEGFRVTAEHDLIPEEVLDLGEYEAAFAKVLQAVPREEQRLAEDRLRAGALWARLRRLTAEERMTVISTHEAYQSFALLDRLLGECLTLRSRPEQYQEVATAAVLVAVRLSPARYSAAQRSDLWARALLELANAARINMDFRTAAQALQKAGHALNEGGGDPLEQARLLSYEGSLWVDLGQFEKGTDCFLRCYEIYDSLSERHLMGRALIKQAHAVGQLEPEKAIAMLKQALGYIDVREEPVLELAARHNLALALCDAGRPGDALSLVESSRSLYEQFPETKFLLRLAWLEAKILLGLSLFQDAAFALDSVREAFLVERMEQEHVLASIDLARVLIELGNSAQAVSLLAEIYTWLESWGMHSEGLGVLLLAREALGQERRGALSLRALTTYFKRAWLYPLAVDPDS